MVTWPPYFHLKKIQTYLGKCFFITWIESINEYIYRLKCVYYIHRLFKWWSNRCYICCDHDTCMRQLRLAEFVLMGLYLFTCQCMNSLSQIFKTDAQCLEEKVSSTQEESTLFQRLLLHTGCRQLYYYTH